MHARDLMTSPTITCHVNDPLSVAARRMWDGDVGVLPVINDDGKLTGMITDRDVCMAALMQGRELDKLLVNAAMARHVISATPDATIGDIERLMAKHQIRRIPIVDASGKPIGIISMNDLALGSAKPKTELAQAPSKITHTLAAICVHRNPNQQAA